MWPDLTCCSLDAKTASMHSALCHLVARHWPAYSHIPCPILSFPSRLVSKASGGSGSDVAILNTNRVVAISLERREYRCQRSLHENRFGRRGFRGLCHRASAGC